MSENSFSDYELISHKTNQGTVKNIYDAVQKARGRYLKLISPGDALIGENALADWIYKMKLSGSAWSFCDAVYYNSCPKRFYRKRYFAHPQLVNVYKTTMQSKCTWNYVILDDIALGAATIITKELLMEYLERIVGRVIYAEDNVFRIMMYEGEIPYYYSRTCLKYEFGEGISTSENDSWKQKLRADWNATDDIMLNDEMNIDLLQKKIRVALAWKNNNDSKKIWTIKKFFLKGKLMCVIRKKLNPRLVKVE